jgi:hypothetical protein
MPGILSPNSRTIDFALLTEEIEISPQEDTAHIVILDPISISNERFEDLFYFRPDGKFRINSAECDSTEYLLSEKTVEELSFNLITTIIGFYEEDLELASTLWEVCSLMELRKQLTKLNSLCKYCTTSCSLTLGEIVHIIESEGGVVDGTTIHRLRLSLLFTNSNPDIRDVRIVLQFDVPLEFVPLGVSNARAC